MKLLTLLVVPACLCSLQLEGQNVQETHELTLNGARTIMEAAMAYAIENQAPGAAITIVDATGMPVLLERMDGTFPISAEVSWGKARSAALFRFPTVNLENAINGGRTALITTGETALKGGLPIIYKGKVIGGIGVSGAASAEQDEEIAAAGLKATFLQ